MVYKLYITVVQVILKGVKQHNIKRYNNTGAIYIYVHFYDNTLVYSNLYNRIIKLPYLNNKILSHSQTLSVPLYINKMMNASNYQKI